MSYRFLLVEDDDLVSRVTREVLRLNLDGQVDVAPTAEEGLALFEKRHGGYDLLVCDLNLPEMGGLELCRIVREKNEQLPIIILTGYPSDTAYEQASRIGVNEFVQKPFQPESFVELIGNILSTRRKRTTRLKHFEAQFWEQADMILAGKIPAGYSSLDFITRMLRRGDYDETKVNGMEKLVPLLKTEMSYLDARDNYLHLKTLREQRIGRIQSIRGKIQDD